MPKRVPCIYCKEAIQADALVCPYCRLSQSGEPLQNSAPAEDWRVSLYIKWQIIGAVVAGVAVLVIFSVMAANGEGPFSSKHLRTSADAAIEAAQTPVDLNALREHQKAHLEDEETKARSKH